MRLIGTKTAPYAILLVCAVVLCLVLAGCSSNAHEVIDNADTCVGCHGENRSTYDVTPENVEAVASTVTVSTSASEVAVCEPLFPYEGDESFYVPRAVSVVQVTDGSATVQLEEGTWALVAGEDESAARVLVTVSDDGAQSIEL